MKKRLLSKNVILLSVVSLLNDIASDMIYPILPIFITSLGGTAKTLGFIEGVAESTASILKLIVGRVSDKIKKRKILAFWGYFLSNALRPFYFIATHWFMVFFIRFSDRVGKGIRTAPRDALIAESTCPENRARAFGFHRSLDNLGALIGPLLATLILSIFSQNIKLVFLISIVPGVLVILLFLLIKENPTGKIVKEYEFKNIPKLSFKNQPKQFKLFVFTVFIFTLGNSSDAFLILRLKEAGLDSVYIPLVWGFFNLVKSIGNYPAGVIADRIDRRKVIFTGWIWYGIIYILMGIVSSTFMVTAIFLLYGMYHSLTEGAERAYIADCVSSEFRGSAYGIYNFAISISTLPASFLFGYLWDKFSYKVAFFTGASFSFIATALFLILTKHKI